MPVTVVVGGQFGSEGKGKVTAHLALTSNADFVVRCGGPNSGHTVDIDGCRYELKQVPAGFVNQRTRLLVAGGALVNPHIFLQEVQMLGLDPTRIGIDENAGIIEDADKQEEADMGLQGRLGSTGMGVGSAVSRRVLRTADFRQAKDVPELEPYLTCVRTEMAAASRHDQSVIVEGTQGFGLSLYHAEEWPYRTSRDTTAHSFLGEVGLGVRDYDVVMCIRTYPIRVAGKSGPIPKETTWEAMTERSGYPHLVQEFTTTTKHLRRVAEFDWKVVDEAVAANAPTAIALHGADYLDYGNKSVTEFSSLTNDAQEFVRELESRTGVSVRFVGTGPTNEDLVDRRIPSGALTLTPSRTS